MDKTIPELNQETGIPIKTLRDAAEQGRLPARKIGPLWIINIMDPKYEEFKSKYRPKARKSAVQNQGIG